MKLNKLATMWLLALCLLLIVAFITSQVNQWFQARQLNLHNQSQQSHPQLNPLQHMQQSDDLLRYQQLNLVFESDPSLLDVLQLAQSQQSAETPPPPAPAPRQTLSEHIVTYHIDVTLDAEENKLFGTQVVTWQHPGQEPINELYMHLYPNAFASKQSTFMQESGGRLRNDTMSKDSYGQMTISTIRSNAGDDLSPYMSYVQPDDHNAPDRTLMQLALPTTLYPGEVLTLHLQYEVTLPRVFARMGYAEDGFVMAGQWFPKFAAYERKGTRERLTEGWNIHQYHGNSEFYANFGIYNIRIHVPRDYIVAATGLLTKQPELSKHTKTYHYYAEDVHDFAWAASPHFVYVEVPFSTPDIPGVRIKLYLDPAHAHLQERYLHAVRRSLAQFSAWYGEYPYATLSVVVPPAGAGGAGGMEYPTLITAWAADETDPGFELERVIVHEIGHQYFYGMVASNEFEEAWLDEAFTSYAEDKVMQAEYGITPALPIEASYVTSPAALQKVAWAYDDHAHYADNVYIRGKLVLWDIERQIGAQKMEQVLRNYVQRWKFKHPSTENFQTVLEEVSGRRWQAYFDDFVYGAHMVDYAVHNIQVTPQNDNKSFESKVLINNNGPAHHAVTILFHFADGTEVYKTWDGKQQAIQYELLHTAPVDWVMIDPDHALVLENKHMNNFLKTTVPRTTKVRWHLGMVKFIETLINWVTW